MALAAADAWLSWANRPAALPGGWALQFQARAAHAAGDREKARRLLEEAAPLDKGARSRTGWI